MSQLDNAIARLAHGAPLWVVLALAVVLGLRHATDPDHLAAVTTLVASDRRDGPRAACRLGLSWGLGHAFMLIALGTPAVLLRPYLPQAAQRAAEALVGGVIGLLAIRLLRRWRQGSFRAHDSDLARRSPLTAFAIGLLHGFGGSAGAAVLLLATLESRPMALGALTLLALATAISMTALSMGFGLALVRFPAQHTFTNAVPILGVASLGFGTWYAFSALIQIPSSF